MATPLLIEIETTCTACRHPLTLTTWWTPGTPMRAVRSECLLCDLPVDWKLSDLACQQLEVRVAREAPAELVARLNDRALADLMYAYMHGRRRAVTELVGAPPPDDERHPDDAARLRACRAELLAVLTTAP